jgi:hypothetical protein
VYELLDGVRVLGGDAGRTGMGSGTPGGQGRSGDDVRATNSAIEPTVSTW